MKPTTIIRGGAFLGTSALAIAAAQQYSYASNQTQSADAIFNAIPPPVTTMQAVGNIQLTNASNAQGRANILAISALVAGLYTAYLWKKV
jgi:hypothetical protein